MVLTGLHVSHCSRTKTPLSVEDMGFTGTACCVVSPHSSCTVQRPIPPRCGAWHGRGALCVCSGKPDPAPVRGMGWQGLAVRVFWEARPRPVAGHGMAGVRCACVLRSPWRLGTDRSAVHSARWESHGESFRHPRTISLFGVEIDGIQ